MGPEGAVNIVYRRELDKAADPERGARRNGSRSSARSSPTRTSPPARLHRRGDRAARDAREADRRARDTRNKRDTNPPKKHGNIPL